MTMTYQELNLGTPARHRIRVRGILDQSWSGRLGGMTITMEQEDEAPVTTLYGRLLDQAALLGVLNTLYDYYHAPLLSVEFLGSA
jgi:hypothetical protein